MYNIVYIAQGIVSVFIIYVYCKCCLSFNNNFIIQNSINNSNNSNNINNESERSYNISNNLPKYSEYDTLLSVNNGNKAIIDTDLPELPKYDDIV